MPKLAGDTAVQFLTKLSNADFVEGVYLEEWWKAIIISIFKKGNTDNTDNKGVGWGISLLSLIGKCYTSVLNNKLVTWAGEMTSCQRHKLESNKDTQ